MSLEQNTEVSKPQNGARGLRAAQYVRMSTEHQRYSTENQSSAIAEYAKAHGIEIVRTYEDAGKSGLTLKGRPGLQRLLDDVQGPGRDFELVLVYDVSRWGRFPDPDEAASYVHACKKRGVAIVYCAEPFQNDGSLPSAIMIGLKRGMAAEYSRELSVKVFRGACTIVQHGYRQGGTAGYGLRRQLLDEQRQPKGLLARGQHKSIQTDRVILVPGPLDELSVVRRIYDLFLRGNPERVIAAILNRENVATETGRPWSRGVVHQILTNEKYIGNNVYNRTSFKLKAQHVKNPPEEWVRKADAFPALVPIETFFQVREIIAQRSSHYEDDQLLGMLRQLLAKHGALSGLMIDEEEALPSSSAFRSRFGSLLRAYRLVGYTPARDYAYLEINRALRKMHPTIVENMSRQIEAAGGHVQPHGNTGLLLVNGEFTASLVVAPCKPTPAGSMRWRMRFENGLQPDVTLVTRLCADNRVPYDYYVFPSLDFSQSDQPRLDNNGLWLDLYRTDDLHNFYHLAGRAPLKESA